MENEDEIEISSDEESDIQVDFDHSSGNDIQIPIDEIENDQLEAQQSKRKDRKKVDFKYGK